MAKVTEVIQGSDDATQVDGGIFFHPGGGTVGHYAIDSENIKAGIGFCLKTKPALLHRLFVRFMFGWVWVDKIESGSGVDYPTLDGKPLAGVWQWQK